MNYSLFTRILSVSSCLWKIFRRCQRKFINPHTLKFFPPYTILVFHHPPCTHSITLMQIQRFIPSRKVFLIPTCSTSFSLQSPVVRDFLYLRGELKMRYSIRLWWNFQQDIPSKCLLKFSYNLRTNSHQFDFGCGFHKVYLLYFPCISQ